MVAQHHQEGAVLQTILEMESITTAMPAPLVYKTFADRLSLAR